MDADSRTYNPVQQLREDGWLSGVQCKTPFLKRTLFGKTHFDIIESNP